MPAGIEYKQIGGARIAAGGFIGYNGYKLLSANR